MNGSAWGEDSEVAAAGSRSIGNIEQEIQVRGRGSVGFRCPVLSGYDRFKRRCAADDSAIKLVPELKMDVRGRDSVTGMPRTVEITSTEITEAIYSTLNAIIGSVKGVLEQTPPELASDIIDKGIVMAGGTSMLRNLDKLMTNVTGVPCHVAEDPLLCTVKGTGIAIENIDLYKRSITKK